MNGFAIGPLLFSAERVAVILAIVVVLGAAEILSRRVDRRFGRWSYLALAAGLIGARAGHVIENLQSFSETPWRVFAVWQGGFSLPWAALPLAAVTVLALRRPRLIAWGAGVLAAAFLVWNTSHQLTTSSAKPPLPDLILASLKGPPVQLSATGGRPTVINLWATWCPPCRREMPVLAAAAKANPDTRFIFANSPDLNPIEQVFAKLKHLMRKAQPRDVEATWRMVGQLLDLFSSQECANYLTNAGYGSV